MDGKSSTFVVLSLIGLLIGLLTNAHEQRISDNCQQNTEIVDNNNERRAVNPRIINGVLATYGDFPYIVTVQVFDDGQWRHSCGGTILTPRSILTAAHCVAWNHTDIPFRVGAGIHRLNEVDQFEVYKDVLEFIVHPLYESERRVPGHPYDLAILRLTSGLIFNSHISSIRHASPFLNLTGVQCSIAGWGATSANGTLPNSLMTTNVTVISEDECRSRYVVDPTEVILDTHVCSFDPPKTPCHKDSGGPLQCEGVLAGVVSWGYGECDPSLPVVYTRLSEYFNWIQDNIH